VRDIVKKSFSDGKAKKGKKGEEEEDEAGALISALAQRFLPSLTVLKEELEQLLLKEKLEKEEKERLEKEKEKEKEKEEKKKKAVVSADGDDLGEEADSGKKEKKSDEKKPLKQSDSKVPKPLSDKEKLKEFPKRFELLHLNFQLFAGGVEAVINSASFAAIIATLSLLLSLLCSSLLNRRGQG